MSDSQSVDVNTDNLDDFSNLLFGNKPVEKEVEVPEVPETPSATEDPEEGEVEESEAEAEGPAEDGEDAPAAEEDDEVEEETPKPKGRKPAGVRIRELTTKAYDAERRADALAQELAAIKSQSQTDQPEDKTARQVQPLEAEAPHPDDLVDGQPKYPLGEFDPVYIAELTRFIIRKETEAEKVRQETDRQTREQQTAAKELLDSWTEKVQTVAERLPDLAEKVTELESSLGNLTPQYGEFLASTIMSLEYGPDVLNYLADHPDEAQSIADSGPTKATIALGRLEARFITGNEVEKGTVVPTKAPTPPPTNKGSGGATRVAADTDDLDAFEKQFFK